ncbi:hypothetical protein [Alkalibacillus silvisoli]|uniref:Uncharacterized protein n=1 Tax=Alkalibacillus silvisoli TaxID=392823 RepID=A0ABN0ZLE4_9BACI
MKLSGKAIVGILFGIVIVMGFLIYFLFNYIENRGLVDESMNWVNVMVQK